MTQYIIASTPRAQFDIDHLNTSDNRRIDMVGRIDALELYLFIKNVLKECVFLSRKPDIVYIPISQTAIGFVRDIAFITVARVLSRRSRVVLHLHGSNFRVMFERAPRMYRFLMKRVLRAVSGIIVLGERLKVIFEGLVRADRVFVLPNGIPEPIANGIPSNRGEQFQVIYLGNLVRGKGFFRLLEAVPLVLAENEAVRFCFVGDWVSEGDKGKVARFISDKGLESRVTFKGQIVGREKFDLLRSSDVFVFPPYLSEGQPLVLLEAMACGLPILATDKGAIPETVLNGENGFIMESGGAETIAERILFMAGNRELCVRMGRNGRLRYETQYSIETFVSRLGSVWKAVLQSDM